MKKEDLEKRSVILGASAMIILAFIMYTFELIKFGNCNYGVFGIITIFNASVNLYKAIKTKDKVYLISGIIWTLLTMLCVYFYFDEILKVVKK